MTPARLKPGRKPSDRAREEENIATSPYLQPVQPRNTGGLSRSNKFKHQLSKLGVDAEYLRKNGFNLLNHTVLGRLMRFALPLFIINKAN